MREFYKVLKAKVEAGQYALEEMIGDIQSAYDKGYISGEQMYELIDMAKESVDLEYDGIKYPTNYDLDQDLVMSEHDISIVALFELLVSTLPTKARSGVGIAERSIASSYARLIIAGIRTFDSVPDIIKQEVADKLIELGRKDLINDPEYLPREDEITTLPIM